MTRLGLRRRARRAVFLVLVGPPAALILSLFAPLLVEPLVLALVEGGFRSRL